MKTEIDKFILDQLSVWREVAANFRSLKSATTRQVEVGGLRTTIQHNPIRIVSTAAPPPGERACFACLENRPEDQIALKMEGRKGRTYDILVNRYPIFPKHLVIVSSVHEPQTIWHRFVDMLDIAAKLDGFTVFYNGPASGASFPEHLHFQAAPKGFMPLERSVDNLLSTTPDAGSEMLSYIASVQDAHLFHYRHFTRGVFALRARTPKSMAKMFYRLLDCTPVPEGESEPRFNLLTWCTEGEYRAVVTLRDKKRPACFFEEDASKRFTISPGCADMAGFFVAPVESDYQRLTADVLHQILSECSISEADEERILWRLTRTQPRIEVGIMSGPEICFEIISDGAGPQKVTYREGKIDYNGTLYDELTFEAVTISTLFAEPSFRLFGVTIGKQFHWERKQTQVFAGTLKFIVEAGKVTAVNIIGVEDYLLSVISSEMRASAGLEFLKAHAVISRSWVMSMVRRRGHYEEGIPALERQDLPSIVTWLNAGRLPEGDVPRIVKWFDHEDHKRFDVCADDHCQRYQGLTMAVGENVRRAIDDTWGEVLTFDGKLCDTRFSKCCGGVTEQFSTCWEDADYPYLTRVEDPFCNTSDASVLSQVLNDYDLETKDFYRWTAQYDRSELAALISERSGYDIGELVALEPLERGVSGRIKLLRIRGTKCTIEVGKELIIRRFLSTSHLKSSAFEVEMTPDKVILHGSGWGHGVGLCQIGAANMAHQGYGYAEILRHYYPGSILSHLSE